MIPYEDLVAALDEMNGRVPAAAKPAAKARETGSMRKASEPQVAAFREQPTMAADISDLFEEPQAPEPLRDVSLVTAEPEMMDMMPLATAEPEPQEAFEVLTEEPLAPPPPGEAANDFDILSESELPPPPAAPGPQAADDVLGDNAFSNFFKSSPNNPSENELFDAPTPPPEDSDDDFLPPPPEDWK